MIETFYGTGRRKASIARVCLRNGEGKITVNGKDFQDYFRGIIRAVQALEPLRVTGTLGRFDATITVAGGGPGGQSDAIKLGLARALVRRPALLLLDDATSSLDPTTEARILNGLSGEITSLMHKIEGEVTALADAWHGDDSRKFAAEWAGTHKPVFTTAATLLADMADISQRSAVQQRTTSSH